MATGDNFSLKKQRGNKSNPQQFFRLWIIVVVLELSAMALGIAFFLMVHGLIFGIAWFVPFWEPAHRIYSKVLNTQASEFVRAPIPWWRVILLIVKALLVLFFFYLGIKYLMEDGFLGQNIIYSILSS